MHAPLLDVVSVGVQFGGLRALHEVNFRLDQGDILGVVGPNGAGKSTLFNVISGLYTPTTGAVRFRGSSLTCIPVHRRVHMGIARTFQNIRLFAFMSALENVMVGHHARLRSRWWDSMLHTPLHRREEAQAQAFALEQLAFVGLADKAHVAAHTLSYGDQRRPEIARALASAPTLILLDEPAAGMNPQEKSVLLALIAAIRQRGIAVVFIDHDMPLVFSACERIMVLDYGEPIAMGSPEEIRANPRVIEAYLG